MILNHCLILNQKSHSNILGLVNQQDKIGLAEKVKIIMNNREYQCVRRCLCLNLCRISRNLAGEMTPKWEANRKKRGFWGYFRPRLQSAAAAYSCRTAGKKFLCFSNILSFLHGFYAVLHTTTRLSCIYSLMTIFSADYNCLILNNPV